MSGMKAGFALALLAQAIAFWSVVAALAEPRVAPEAWLVLYATGVVAGIAVAGVARRTWSARAWFAVLFYSIFLAACFYGLNLGLDLLHGANRPKPDLAPYVGGLEFWYFLCPGVSAFATFGCVRALLTTGWRRRST